jgi:4-hydroxy-2-oxoglutarate aldolase
VTEDGDGLIVLPGGGEGFAKFEGDGWIIGRKLGGPGELSEGFGLLLGLEGEAEMQVGDSKIGIEPESFGELLLRVRPVLALGVQRTEIVMELRIIGVGGDCGFHSGDCGGGLSGGGERPCVAGEDVGWQRLLLLTGGSVEAREKRDGFRGRSGLLVGEGEVGLRGGVRGLDGESLLKLVNAGRHLTEADEDGTEGAVSLLGVRGEADDGFKFGSRGGEVVAGERGNSGAVVGVGLLETGGGFLRSCGKDEKQHGEKEARCGIESGNDSGNDCEHGGPATDEAGAVRLSDYADEMEWSSGNRDPIDFTINLMLLEGIFPAVTTPFYPDGSLYTKKLEHNIDRYSRTPASGMVVLGSTGEAVMLSDEESRTVLRVARESAAAEKVLVAGVGRESLAETLRLAEFAADLQYDAVLVRSPHYYGAQTGHLEMLTYYRALADRSPLPVLLYSIPKFTHYELPVEVIAELAQHPNIIGIKDSSGSVERVAEIVAATRNAGRREMLVTQTFTAFTNRMMLAMTPPPEHFVSAEALGGAAAVAVAPPLPRVKMMRKKEVGFQVLCGAAHTLLNSLETGATGGVLALAACAPQACQEIYTAWKDNDPAIAREKQQRVVEASKLVAGKLGIPAIKHACDLNGYYGGRPRIPLLPLDAEKQAEVARVMADLRN